jgi:hypothetical protein
VRTAHGGNHEVQKIGITAMTLFAALAMPVSLAADIEGDHDHKHHHYRLITVGTFGWPNSGSNDGGGGNSKD